LLAHFWTRAKSVAVEPVEKKPATEDTEFRKTLHISKSGSSAQKAKLKSGTYIVNVEVDRLIDYFSVSVNERREIYQSFQQFNLGIFSNLPIRFEILESNPDWLEVVIGDAKPVYVNHVRDYRPSRTKSYYLHRPQRTTEEQAIVRLRESIFTPKVSKAANFTEETRLIIYNESQGIVVCWTGVKLLVLNHEKEPIFKEYTWLNRFRDDEPFEMGIDEHGHFGSVVVDLRLKKERDKPLEILLYGEPGKVLTLSQKQRNVLWQEPVPEIAGYFSSEKGYERGISRIISEYLFDFKLLPLETFEQIVERNRLYEWSQSGYSPDYRVPAEANN
jgi:hypothetical protein